MGDPIEAFGASLWIAFLTNVNNFLHEMIQASTSTQANNCKQNDSSKAFEGIKNLGESLPCQSSSIFMDHDKVIPGDNPFIKENESVIRQIISNANRFSFNSNDIIPSAYADDFCKTYSTLSGNKKTLFLMQLAVSFGNLLSRAFEFNHRL